VSGILSLLPLVSTVSVSLYADAPLLSVIMPYLSHLIPVALPANVAVPYLRQLASAVGYLHERGITHNDIKPANVMMSHNDVPVLVDFGFAQRWELGQRGSFLSSISWGTPEVSAATTRVERHDRFTIRLVFVVRRRDSGTWLTLAQYLDPHRARGMPHDERASDVWALGVGRQSASYRCGRDAPR
jgi:protein-serine/threonine kinase